MSGSKRGLVCIVIAASIFAVGLSFCGRMTPEAQYIRQAIPVEIESGKPVTIQIQSLSGNGVNDIGIRCSPEVWKTLSKNAKAIKVHLKSSDKPSTEIGGIDPQRGGGAFLECPRR